MCIAKPGDDQGQERAARPYEGRVWPRWEWGREGGREGWAGGGAGQDRLPDWVWAAAAAAVYQGRRCISSSRCRAQAGVGVQVGVGVGEDVGGSGGGGARPQGRPVSVPSPGPGYGTRAVLAFTPPQAFRGQDRTTTPVMSGHRQNSSAQRQVLHLVIKILHHAFVRRTAHEEFELKN